MRVSHQLKVLVETRQTSRTEKALLFDLNKPSLHALSYALRHPDTWPKGFAWNYARYNQCAMGLAHRLWQEKIDEEGGWRERVSEMARVFALPYESATQIFIDAGQSRKIEVSEWFGLVKKKRRLDLDFITPEMIADDIDAYLAKVE